MVGAVLAIQDFVHQEVKDKETLLGVQLGQLFTRYRFKLIHTTLFRVEFKEPAASFADSICI